MVFLNPTRRDVLRYGAASGAALAAGSLPGLANSASGPFKIALSNAYNGNEWRRQHAEAFERAAKEMVDMGIFREFSAVHGSDNSVPAQLAAIGDMILQGNDGIMINCSSGSQVGGVIEQAADAGIKVVSYDAYASSDRSHNIGFDFGSWGTNNAEFVEKHLGGAGKAQGNVLIVNLSLGATAGKLIRDEYTKMLERNPGIKLVGEVEGQATRSVAQRNVAQVVPGLPKTRRGARRRRQRLLRHRRGNARLRLHHGEHAADLHRRRRRLYPVVARGARQARLQRHWPERRPGDRRLGDVLHGARPARRRQRAEGLVRAFGLTNNENLDELHRRHRRADPGADLHVRPDPRRVHPDGEAAWLTGGRVPMAAGDRFAAAPDRSDARRLRSPEGAASAPPGGAGDRQVVRNDARRAGQVDFEVRAAEIVALMGGNGAGKSTLMKIVGGLLPADAGEIELLRPRVGRGPFAARGHGARAAVRAPGAVALPEPSRLRELRGGAARRDARSALEERSRSTSPATALADVFPGNRHRSARQGRRAVAVAAADGGDRPLRRATRRRGS